VEPKSNSELAEAKSNSELPLLATNIDNLLMLQPTTGDHPPAKRLSITEELLVKVSNPPTTSPQLDMSRSKELLIDQSLSLMPDNSPQASAEIMEKRREKHIRHLEKKHKR
jgi:hypothetical protein